MQIQGIPAVQYGQTVEHVYLFVHGKNGYKEEAEPFAQIVCPKGYQVLSIDLPGHGSRKEEADRFVPWQVVPELQALMQYAKAHWKHISLRATSIGSWFSMLAYQDEPLETSLLVSPVLDMQQLIEQMMLWANVTPEQLQRQGRIPTDFGETLDWDYYQYVKRNRIQQWHPHTAILYAGQDNLTPRQTVDSFCKRFHCGLTVMEDGEHWFHTKEHLSVLTEWTQKHT